MAFLIMQASGETQTFGLFFHGLICNFHRIITFPLDFSDIFLYDIVTDYLIGGDHMAHYPFSERPDLLVLTCTHVLEGGDVTVVCHHFNDNTWEFICGGTHTEEDAIVLSVGELCEMDPTLNLVCDLPVGGAATRQSRSHAWEFGRIEGEEFYPAASSRMQ